MKIFGFTFAAALVAVLAWFGFVIWAIVQVIDILRIAVS